MTGTNQRTIDRVRTVADLRRAFPVGTRVEVTNHFITKPDHPCFGTRRSVVTGNSSANITLEPGGCSSWPKRDQMVPHSDGSVTILGPRDGREPFLTLRPMSGTSYPDHEPEGLQVWEPKPDDPHEPEGEPRVPVRDGASCTRKVAELQ